MLCSWQNHGFLSLVHFWSQCLPGRAVSLGIGSPRVWKGAAEMRCFVVQLLAAVPCNGQSLEGWLRKSRLPYSIDRPNSKQVRWKLSASSNSQMDLRNKGYSCVILACGTLTENPRPWVVTEMSIPQQKEQKCPWSSRNASPKKLIEVLKLVLPKLPRKGPTDIKSSSLWAAFGELKAIPSIGTSSVRIYLFWGNML